MKKAKSDQLSTGPSNADVHHAGVRVLRAGMHLALNGFGRMAVLPYIGGPGCWRCDFHVLGYPSRVLFSYTHPAGFAFLADHAGGSVRKNIRPAALAEAIMVSVPEHLKQQCQGIASSELVRWWKDLDQILDRVPALPTAFREQSPPNAVWELTPLGGGSGHELPSPPGYLRPDEDPPLMQDPFWRPRLARWDALSRQDRVSVAPDDIVEGQELDAIATQLWQDFHALPSWETGVAFRLALKAALVALQAGDESRP
jgi:hypothetical protein